MLTVQNHVYSVLAKSAKTAAEEIIKLFDSSFEAFSEELRKRQQELDTLRRKLGVPQTQQGREANPGAAYLCGQCGISLSSMIQLEENQKAEDTGNSSTQDLETDVNDQTLDLAPIEESDTEEYIEFEVPPEEDDSYESADHKQTVYQEEPTSKDKSISEKVMSQKRGRGRPRKHQAEAFSEVLKRGRGRPRKAKVPVSLQKSRTFSSPEEQKKESGDKPQAVKHSHIQTSLYHKVVKEDLQSKSKMRSQKKRRGRPKSILNSLFIPFGEAQSISHGQENHVRGPDPLKNKPVSTMEQHLPLENSREVLADKRQQRKVSWIVCPKCPRKFRSKRKLQAHAKFHLKKGEMTCRTCGMTFIGQCQMSNHEKVHTGEKPFSCPFCPRRYPNLSQFKKHMLNHTAPDYACEVCGLRASHVSRDTFRKAHLRSKEPCSNCALIYT